MQELAFERFARCSTTSAHYAQKEAARCVVGALGGFNVGAIALLRR